ncbi:hypothetical protein J1N35_044861, partial [Gossypium stocksii]
SFNYNVEVIQWMLNPTANKLIIKDDALEVMATNSKEYMEELKGELIIYKAL